MNTTPTITRRHLLGTIAGLWLSLILPSARSGWAAAASGDAPLSTRLTALLRNQHSARLVGLAYLRLAPEETNREVLCIKLLRALTLTDRTLRTADIAGLRRRVSSVVRRDFQQEQIVELDGWIISRTEARLCALAALG